MEVKEVTEVALNVHFSIAIGADRAIGKPVGVPAEGTAMPVVQQKKPNWPQPPANTQQQRTASTPNGRNLSVVGATGTEQSNTSTTVTNQLQRKGVNFFGMVSDMDSFGGEYIDCYDEENKDIQFRVYKNSYFNIETLLGEYFTADVNAMCTHQAEGTYYKLSAGSIVMAAPKEKYYVDAKNKLLTKKEWEDKYQGCSFCTAPLVAGDPVKFTKDGDCLCESCAKDPQVLSAVQLA